MGDEERRRRESGGGHAKVYVGRQRRTDHLDNDVIVVLDPLLWPGILGRRERQGEKRRALDERTTSKFRHERFGAEDHPTGWRRRVFWASSCFSQRSAGSLIPLQCPHLFLTQHDALRSTFVFFYQLFFRLLILCPIRSSPP